MSIHRINHAPKTQATAIPALADMGRTKRGSDEAGQMY
jgi:hypothetical protein